LAHDPFDRSGAYVRGDFDNDGLMDVVASSPETDCGKGAVYVLMGAGGSTSWAEDTTGILEWQLRRLRKINDPIDENRP
jgi:hypothetical protein